MGLQSMDTGASCLALVSFGDERSDVERWDMDGRADCRILFPQFWDKREAHDQTLPVESQM